VGTLQRTIARLRAELEGSGGGGGGALSAGKHDDTETGKMRHEIGRLRREKEDLAEACESLEEENRDMRREIQSTFDRGEGAPRDDPGPEMRKLRRTAQEAEKEAGRMKRMLSKKSSENDMLVDELEKVRQAERRLRGKCRELTSELEVNGWDTACCMLSSPSVYHLSII